MRGIDLTVPMPPRVAKLPQYKGMPVTVTTFVDDNGIPNFRAIDHAKVWPLKRDHRCGICGEPLDYWIAFIASPSEVAAQMVYDNPYHEDCARYALAVCPWLVYARSKYADVAKLPAPEGFTFLPTHPDREAMVERPDRMALYVVRSYENVIDRNRVRGCKVPAPKRLEWFPGR